MHTQSSASPTLVTGVPGNIGGLGRAIVENLRRRGIPVRALAHREDERTDALRSLGAEIVTGELTHTEDVSRAFDGCRRLYFGMSVSASYLEATVIAAAVARQHKDLEVLVNISQIVVMAQLHAEDRYDRLTHDVHDVDALLGRPATSVRAYVAKHPELWRAQPAIKAW